MGTTCRPGVTAAPRLLAGVPVEEVLNRKVCEELLEMLRVQQDGRSRSAILRSIARCIYLMDTEVKGTQWGQHKGTPLRSGVLRFPSPSHPYHHPIPIPSLSHLYPIPSRSGLPPEAHLQPGAHRAGGLLPGRPQPGHQDPGAEHPQGFCHPVPVH